jgi:hypothetical protein
MEKAMIHVVAVRVPRPYVLDVTFDDGTRRQVDLEPELWGEVFAPLRDPVLFAQVEVDPELGTVVWPNGADLAPEFLYFGEEGPPPDYFAGESAEDSPAAADGAPPRATSVTP